MQKNYETINGLDTEILAISADSPSQAEKAAESLGLSYPILFDADSEVVGEYGVDNLHGDGVPAPAVFIVDKAGDIRWQYISGNPYDWPDVEQVISQLRMVQAR